MWDKTKQQTDKLIEHYNNTIKPTLLEFYKLTGEDIDLEIEEDNNSEEMPTITFTNGNRISCILYSCKYTNTTVLTDTKYYHNIYRYHDDELNIKVFYQYWNKILKYMNERIKSISKEYEDLISNNIKGSLTLED